MEEREGGIAMWGASVSPACSQVIYLTLVLLSSPVPTPSAKNVRQSAAEVPASGCTSCLPSPSAIGGFFSWFPEAEGKRGKGFVPYLYEIGIDVVRVSAMENNPGVIVGIDIAVSVVLSIGNTLGLIQCELFLFGLQLTFILD